MNTISIAPRLALIAGAAVLLGIPSAATGQAIEVRPGMSVGDTWRYSASLDVLISQETEHEAEMGRVVQTAHMELEAVREGADGEGHRPGASGAVSVSSSPWVKPSGRG